MNEDKIIEKLIEHDERFDKIDQKMDTFKEEILQGQDEIIRIVKRLDEDRVFTHKWVERIESELEDTKMKVSKQETEIQEVKAQLHIA
jgi:DNA anti-recombination protein RmuC